MAMSEARHDHAVSMLTSSGNEVTLVVYREQLVEKDSQQPVYQRKSVLEVPKAAPMSLDEAVAPIVEEPEPIIKLESGPVLRGPLLKSAAVTSPLSQPPKTDSSAYSKTPHAPSLSSPKRAPPPVASKPMPVASKAPPVASSVPLVASRAPPVVSRAPPVASKPILHQSSVTSVTKTVSSTPPVSQSTTSSYSSPTHVANSQSARTSFFQTGSTVPPPPPPVTNITLVDQFNNISKKAPSRTNSNNTSAPSSPTGPTPASRTLITHNSIQDSNRLMEKSKSPTRLMKQDSQSPPVEVLNA